MNSAVKGLFAGMSFRGAITLLFACQLILLAASGLPFRNVVFPSSNAVEVGAGAEAEAESVWINNRKFSDESIGFLPALAEQLEGNRSRWISTWNPHQQLGHPLPQLGGTSKAYLPTHALSLIVSDPLQLYSLLFMATLLMTGLFMFLFLKELSLLPVACFVGGIGLSFGVYFLYWATFLITVSGICWTTAILWLVTKYFRDRSCLSLAGFSFSLYCLLLSAYPQQIVLFGYLLLLYGAVALWRLEAPLGQKTRLIALLSCSAAIAAVAVLPTYGDVYEAARRSTRLGADLDFFLAVLPKFESAGDAISYAAKTVSPFWFGNPARPEYPLQFNGVGFGLLSLWLFLLSALSLGRRLWLWHLFIGLCFLATVSVPIYIFMNRYMGFHFSRCIPTVGAVIPFVVVGSYAVDAICRGQISKRRLLISVALLVLVAGLVPFVAVGGDLARVDVRFVLLDLLLLAIIIAGSLSSYAAPAVVVAAVLSSLVASQSLLLVRSPESIRLSSAALESVRMHTDNGKNRFAKVGEEIAWFAPSSQEALYGVKSIHSYDSLSSKGFQSLAGRISGTGAQVFGRVFHVLDTAARLDRHETALMAISLILSRHELSTSDFTLLEEVEGIRFYRPALPPVRLLQTTGYESVRGQRVTMAYETGLEGSLPLLPQAAFDDRKAFRTAAVPERTLLFLSEQYHPKWRAYAAGMRLPVVPVNGFFLGVLVPPQTASVELRFEPFVTGSWVPQLFYIVMFLAGLSSRLLTGRERAASPKRVSLPDTSRLGVAP